MDYFLITTSLLKIVAILFLVILPMVSYSVYAERRVSAFIQDRRGPNSRRRVTGTASSVPDGQENRERTAFAWRTGDLDPAMMRANQHLEVLAGW